VRIEVLDQHMAPMGSGIRTAVESCVHAQQVIAYLSRPGGRMTNAMAKLAVELIAFKLVRKGIGKLSLAGEKALKEVFAIQKEILELQDGILKTVSDNNKQLSGKIADMLPKLQEKHAKLEQVLAKLYKEPVTDDFAHTGEKALTPVPPEERSPVRPRELDYVDELGRKRSRAQRRGLTLVEKLGELVNECPWFKTGSGGKAGTLTVGGKTFKVLRALRFEGAEGAVFIFDLRDTSVAGGVRRAVQTRIEGKLSVQLEFTVLKVPYGSKPIVGHLLHANHVVSDVPMNAFRVFGEAGGLGYSYEKWWTVLLSNSRAGTAHQRVTARQQTRLPDMRKWADDAQRAFKAAIKFNKESGKPGGPALSDFKQDLRKFSFAKLLEEAAGDLDAAGVSPSERQAALDAFRQQARNEILPLLEKKLHPEHVKAIAEGL